MQKNIRQDPTSLIWIIIGVVVVCVLAYGIMPLTSEITGDIKDDLNASDIAAGTNESAESIALAAQTEADAIPLGDQLIFWFFIAAIIGYWVSAAYEGFHIVTMIIYICVVILGIMVGAMGADIRDDLNTGFAGVGSGSFTMTNNLLGRNLPAILAVVGVIGLIIMYSKKGSGGFQQ